MPTQMSARAAAVFARTYSRPKDEGGYETFEEVIDRVIGHQRWLWERAGGQLGILQLDELELLRDLMLNLQAFPAGRTLWLGGTEISRTREVSQFNCGGEHVKTVYDFVDFFWLLLNGSGVGGKPINGCLNGFANPITDVRVIRSTRILGEAGGHSENHETWDPSTATWTIVVGDSGEAWAKALGKLLAGKYAAKTLVLDFSQIRAEGSLLKRYGWRSSGDTVISKEFPAIVRLLSRRAGQLLRKMDIADLINHLGVIQTGRRGAEILLMDSDDPEIAHFMTFKKDCYADPEKTHRQQSNNSLLFWHRPERIELENIFSVILKSGGNEPGFINAAAARLRAPWFDTANPCVEILLADKGFCNLVTVNLIHAEHRHLSVLQETFRLIARANYRQTLVNLDDGVLQRSWHENNEYLRLCGVSGCGWAARGDLSAHDLRQLKLAATLGAWSMADELGAPRPKNVTCVKPEGTLGKVMDAPEGAHKPLGRYIFNSIVFGRTEPLVDQFRAAGYEVRPHPTEETQVLIKFAVEFENVIFEDFHGTPVNLEPAINQLNRYKLLMDNWCDQNCSITISYDPEEVPTIIDWLLLNWDSYVGVSWCFRTDPTKTAADFGAAYLPQEVVDRATFEDYTAQLRAVDYSGAGAVELDELDDDCATGVCPVR